LVGWIRIRIRIHVGKSNPQKEGEKVKKCIVFEVLDVLPEGLKLLL
jgi:hypothetical protein